MKITSRSIRPHLVFVTGLEVSGGAESMVVALYKYFVENFGNWETSLIVLLRGEKSQELEWSVLGSVIRLNKARTITSVLPIMKVLRDLRPAVVVSSLPHVSSVLEIALLLSGSRAKHFARIEGRLLPNRRKNLLDSIRGKLTIFLLRRAHHLIVVSDRLGTETRRLLRQPASFVTPIPNAFVPQHHLVEVVPKTGGDAKTVRLLVVGRLSQEKNQILALEVLSALLTQQEFLFELHLFGSGADEAFLKVESNNRNLHHRVYFHGFVENRSEIYGSGDILLVTSLHEGQPLCIFEALSFGLPVVSVDCDYGPREILVESWLGSLSEPKPEYLAENILFYARARPGQRDELRRKQYVESHHSLELVAAKHNLVLTKSLIDADEAQ